MLTPPNRPDDGVEGAGVKPPNEKPPPDDGAGAGAVVDPPKLKPLEAGAAGGVDPPKLNPLEAGAGAGVVDPPNENPPEDGAGAGVEDPPKLNPEDGAVAAGAGVVPVPKLNPPVDGAGAGVEDPPKLKPDEGAAEVGFEVEDPLKRPVAAGFDPNSPPPADGVLNNPLDNVGVEFDEGVTVVLANAGFIDGRLDLAFIFLFFTSNLIRFSSCASLRSASKNGSNDLPP